MVAASAYHHRRHDDHFATTTPIYDGRHDAVDDDRGNDYRHDRADDDDRSFDDDGRLAPEAGAEARGQTTDCVAAGQRLGALLPA